MFSKVYIFAEWLEKKEELEKFSFLFDKENIDDIWEYSMKVWKSYEWKIYDVWVLEIFLFFNFLRKKWYNKEDIEIVYDKPMFIYNEEFYFIEWWLIKKQDIKNIWFFSLRASNLNFPFFYILKHIIEKNGGVFSRTNDFNNYVYWKGKFYSLYQLYKYREDTLWDVIIPYNIRWFNLQIFANYLKNNFSNNIVIKKDFSCAWKGVYVIDLENFDDIQEEKFETSLMDNWYFNKTSYILPYYDFEEEFRFYFNKNKDWLKIYSFKRKKVLSTLQEAIDSKNFQYFKNIKIKWEYISSLEYSQYADIFEYARHNINILEFDTWTFECWKTKDGKIIFFEVNSMSATLCFEWEDKENMNSFYYDLFENLFNKKNIDF